MFFKKILTSESVHVLVLTIECCCIRCLERTIYKNKQVYLPPVLLFYTEREEKLIHSYLTAL